MVQFALPRNSRLREGKIWPTPPGARQVKTFRVYRWSPDDGETPRLDVFALDLDRCGPMVLDALIKIKNEIDPTLAFRRSCREGICDSCAMSINGRNWLACIQPIEDFRSDVRVYPLNHQPVIKDLVVDLSHLYAQYRAVKPWLQAETPPPPDGERLQSRAERARINGYWECILCFCCTSGCPSWWWNGDRYLGPGVLLQAYRWIAESRDEATGERLDALDDLTPVSLPHHHELHRDLPQGAEPCKGNCADQDGDHAADSLSRLLGDDAA